MFDSLTRMIALKDDRRGLAAIEYALIASLMCVILVALFPILNNALTTTFNTIGGHLTTGQ